LIYEIFPVVQAVLSQNTFDHGYDLAAAKRPSFNETGYHLQMNNQGVIVPDWLPAQAFSTTIDLLFLYFALGGLVIGGASLRGALFAVGVTTPKRTTNIAPSNIAIIGQKENAAVPASFQAWPQVGMLSDHKTKLAQILRGYRPNPLLPIPVRIK